MRIGELSTRSGFSVKTLRYYDEIGLIRPARRGPVSGIREYGRDTLLLLEIVASAKRAGFQLQEVRTILSAARKGDSLNLVLDMLDRKIDEIGAQVVELHSLRDRLIQIHRSKENFR